MRTTTGALLRVFSLLVLLCVLTTACVYTAYAQGGGSPASNPPDRIRRDSGQVIVKSGGFPTLEPADGKAFDFKASTGSPAISPLGYCRWYYTTSGAGAVRISCNGSPYVTWVAPAAGVGTVSNVGLSLPSIFTVSGSPVTTSGTLTAALVSQLANTVFAAPDLANGLPSFRALTASDIPALAASKITSGTLPAARGGTGLTTPFTLGDVLYADTTTTLNRLAGNNTAVRKFLSTEGNGTVVQSIGYNTLRAADIPAITLSTTDVNGGVTGTLARGNGGTGTTATGSINQFWRNNTTTGALEFATISSPDGSITVQNVAGATNLSANFSAFCTSCTDGRVVTWSSLGFFTTTDYIIMSGSGLTRIKTDQIADFGRADLDPTLAAYFGVNINPTTATSTHVDAVVPTGGKVNLQDSSGTTKLTVDTQNAVITANETIESTSGGFKFPDGTIQTTAATGGSTKVFGGAIPTLDNAVYKRITGTTTGSGDLDLYTVPTGKRVIVLLHRVYNTTGVSLSGKAEVKISGTYYTLSPAATLTATTQTSLSTGNYVYEAGETIAVNCTGANVNFFYTAIEFDNTSPLKSAKLLTLAAGDNTLYTVPSGKTAYVYGNVITTSTSEGLVNIGNNTGGSITVTIHIVPSGGSRATANQTTPATAIATASEQGFITQGTLTAGDFIDVFQSAGTGAALMWVTVSEY